VFGTAAFVGYRVYGPIGVVVGAIGIFIMPCLLAMLAARFIGHWLEYTHAQLFVKGVGLAAAGAVAATAVGILRPRGVDLTHGIITILAFAAMVHWKKLNPLFVLAGGAILGLMIG
jgi:chromate transport protein ChrA